MFGNVTLLILVSTVLAPTMDIADAANKFIAKIVLIKMTGLTVKFVALDAANGVQIMDLDLRFPFAQAKGALSHIVKTAD